MKELSEQQLVEIGHSAARLVPGLGTVERVKVSYGQDSADKPAYFFSFLIDRDSDPHGRGTAYARLIQAIRDGILALDDDHYPYVRILNGVDWQKVEGAKPG